MGRARLRYVGLSDGYGPGPVAHVFAQLDKLRKQGGSQDLVRYRVRQCKLHMHISHWSRSSGPMA